MTRFGNHQVNIIETQGFGESTLDSDNDAIRQKILTEMFKNQADVYNCILIFESMHSECVGLRKTLLELDKMLGPNFK